MALIHDTEFPWHPGEQALHRLLRAPEYENPTSPFLAPGAARMVWISPLIAIGTLDQNNNPWTSVWGGEPGFSRPVGQSIIGIRTVVDRVYDPVVEALLGGDEGDAEVVEGEKMVGGLSILLEKRRRVKWFGRMVSGKTGRGEEGGRIKEVQLVVRIDQSL
ncbi:MAG: hypothetical protein M1839_004626, partial [Geoglossum umbratile]